MELHAARVELAESTPAPRPMDERDPQPTFTQDHLFNAPRTMRGQLTMGDA